MTRREEPIHDVVLVGAGLGGLSCALACARRGLQVCVLEKDPTRWFRRQGFNLWVPQRAIEMIQEHCGVTARTVPCDYTCDLDTQCAMPILTSNNPQFSQVAAVRRGELRNAMLDAAELAGSLVEVSRWDLLLDHTYVCF